MTSPNYAAKIYRYVFAAALPSLIIALALLWQVNLSMYGKMLISLLLILSVFGFAFAVRSQVNFQLQTLSNLVEAIHLGDFSLRGSRSHNDDALSELVEQINKLAQSLREQRLASQEAYRLLDKVISEINVAIFAFDGLSQVKLANKAATQLMALSSDEVVGASATSLGLADLIIDKRNQVIEHEFAGAKGRWQVRCDGYIDHGVERKLLFIHDIKQVLRDEELNAWKNIMRVISHEVNNSLYPVSSLSQTLLTVVNQTPRESDWLEDVNQGLNIIIQRSERLNEFIKRYATVAKLPQPNKQPIEVKPIIQRACRLFKAQQIELKGCEDVVLYIDPAMFEQVLINLIKNGIEAGTQVTIDWAVEQSKFVLTICDDGPGIEKATNLFVPFYSTKANGSGIGLVLSRQIIEAHRGDLSLANRAQGGCCAQITLPNYQPSDVERLPKQ
ncbi:sensor histidine kinase [Thalassotalea ganghwensis]